MGRTGSAAQLQVDYGTAAAAARLLSLFAEFPSTPGEIAHEAAATAREISRDLPFPQGSVSGRPQRHQAPASDVSLARTTVVSCAGLLGVLGGMPSTPPDLRAEAGRTAESLWSLAGES